MASSDISTALVDALADVYGRHPGQRAAHAKGVLCAGSFRPAPEAARLTRAAHLQGEPVRCHVRFSNGSGDPSAPDTARDGRGMAVKFYLPQGGTTDIVALTLSVFFTRTPEELIEFNVARAPDPQTGQPDLEKVGAFLQAHPETVAAVQQSITVPHPASYLTLVYHGIHAFRFDGPQGSRYGRYRFEPLTGVQTIEEEDLEKKSADYLREDLEERLSAEPGRLRLEVALAEPEDPVDDPTAAWPDDRERVTLGELSIDEPAFDRERDGDVLVFDPTRVTDGIELSDDAILRARPGAYSVSVERRTAA